MRQNVAPPLPGADTGTVSTNSPAANTGLLSFAYAKIIATASKAMRLRAARGSGAVAPT
jgi:hypothetical protein